MRKPLLLILFFSCLAFGAAAQQEESDSIVTGAPIVVTADSAANFDAPAENAENDYTDTTLLQGDYRVSTDSLDARKLSKDYAWLKNIDSLLRKREADREASQTSVSPRTISIWSRIFSSGFLEGFLWLIAGGVVLFIIFRLFLNKGLFRTASKRGVVPAEDEENAGNDIDGRDFDKLALKAAAAGDYRTATRWLFLLTLQRLNDREMIHFGADKTNAAYLGEMPAAKRDAFATLALYYEYIWYGKAPLQPESFELIRNKFTDFLNRI